MAYMRTQRRYTNRRGLLIAFEGADGSGKTTQRKLFKQWLITCGYSVVTTKWNSSKRFHPVIKARKAERSLTPLVYSSLHAADFQERLETVIRPALAAGKIVIADRYVPTAIVRDSLRGVPREHIERSYAGAPEPDLGFYFAVSAETSEARVAADGLPNYYEAGQDVTGLADPVESYRIFVRGTLRKYEELVSEFGMKVIDGERTVFEQHREIRCAFEARYGRTTSPVSLIAPAGSRHCSTVAG